MVKTAKPIPDGFHAVTPYLVVSGVKRLIEFLEKAFGAEVVERHTRPDGTVMHAQVRIADSIVMMGEPWGENAKQMPAALYLYVKDVDAVFKQALAAGGTSTDAPADQFYGDRSGGIKDPSGNQWWIATHKEDVSSAELARRAEAAMKERAKA